jgi:hypothetical protein
MSINVITTLKWLPALSCWISTLYSCKDENYDEEQNKNNSEVKKVKLKGIHESTLIITIALNLELLVHESGVKNLFSWSKK